LTTILCHEDKVWHRKRKAELSCCPYYKQIERHNYEDEAIEPNVSKDSGKGVFIQQHCFYNTVSSVYNLVYLLFTYRFRKKLDCVTLLMLSRNLLLRRIVEKILKLLRALLKIHM
jgi:hypothetical protein